MVTDAKRAAEFVAISDRFARTFSVPEGEPSLLASQRASLGSVAVARAARRAAFATPSFPERLAGLGVRTVVASGPAGEAPVVDASAPCGIVCQALALLSANEKRTILVGPRAQPHLQRAREVLAPQIEAGDISLEESTSGTDALRASFVVAPFYYAKAELRRIAEHIAAERAVPCPEAEGGIELLVSRSWDQRAALGAAIDQSLATMKLPSDPRSLNTVELEASGALETLEQARHFVGPKATSISAFVYPMWREQPAVETALRELLATTSRATVDERPSAIWALGLGAAGGRVIVDSDQRLRIMNTPRAVRRRRHFEANPSIFGAVGVLASRWLGL